MGTPWNPNHPDAIGPEYVAELTRSWTVGSTGGASTGVTQKWRSTVAESDVKLQLFASAVTGSGYLMAEVVEDGDGPLSDIHVAKIKPTTAVRATNMKNQAGSTTLANLLASIDETGDPSTSSDYITANVVGRGQSIHLQFDPTQIATATNGRRVLGVTLGVRTQPRNAADLTDIYTVQIVDEATGQEVYKQLNRRVNADTEVWFNFGELYTEDDDPDAAKPWDEATLTDLCTGGNLAIRIAGGGDGIKFSRVRLVVATAVEERLGVAVFNRGSWDLSDAIVGDGIGDWSEALYLLTPDSSLAAFDKAVNTTYRMIYRRAWTGEQPNNLNVTLPVVSRYDSAVPPAGTYLDDPLLLRAQSVVGPSTASVPSTVASIPSDERDPVGGAVQPVGILPVRLIVAGADSVDGQTYSQVVRAVVDATSGPLNQYVSTFADGAQDYSALRVAIGFASMTNPPTDPLTVTIKDAAGTTTLGSGSITMEAFRHGPHYSGPGVMVETIVDVEVTLPASTQYRIVIDSDTDVGAGWLVGVLSSRGGEGSGVSSTWPDGEATYGGDTDHAFTHPDVATVECDDLSGYLSLAITGPDDLTAAADSLVFAGSQPCGIDAIPYVELGWTPSNLDADFQLYRLQRRDPITTEWEDVALITSEDVDSLDDVEARLAMASEWRIRAEGPTGQVSFWTDIATEELPTVGCGYTFSTNWAPLDAVAYVDVYDNRAERAYEFPDAGEVLVRSFAGRDEFVLFRPTERRSVRFSRELLVRSFRGPTTELIGPAAFDALRELARQPNIPYVAVRDEQGNRWYAGVIVRDGRVRMPAEHHTCNVEVVPVSTIATAPTIEG